MLWHCTKHDLNVGKTKVRIEDDHPLAKLFKLESQIDGSIGLTDTALTTGDSDDSRQGAFAHLIFLA